jgi:hypothetical protein
MLTPEDEGGVKASRTPPATAGGALRGYFVFSPYDRVMKTPFFDIVVPVDGSATANRAIEYAIGVAGDGVTLHFCTVVSDSVISGLGEDAHSVCSDAVALAGTHSRRGLMRTV